MYTSLHVKYVILTRILMELEFPPTDFLNILKY